MTPNNNFNVLPFYSSVAEQNHKKFYAYGAIYTLINPTNRILPFQIVRPHSVNNVTYFALHNMDTGSTTNIVTEATTAGLHVTSFAPDEDYDLIINNGNVNFPSLVMTPGRYYLEMSDEANTWFSEVFTVVKDLTPYLKLEYWDAYRITYADGHIDYTAPYKNYCYIQTEIGKPEYPFEEIAQDRDGHIFVEKQLSEKTYKFAFIAPEYLCDALRIVRMHSFINIYFKGKTYSVESIIFDPKWKDQGDLASMEVEFQCGTVVKKIGRGLAYVGGGGAADGDFNYDYSEDFN